MSTTITLQIGNSDDKLSQKLWSHFIGEIDSAIRTATSEIHFTGCSFPSAPWQNAAWVFNLPHSTREWLTRRVAEIREEYKQDSVAWTEGDTKFI